MGRLGWVGFGNGLPERGFAEFGKCLNFLAGQISERALWASIMRVDVAQVSSHAPFNRSENQSIFGGIGE
jgi:hypothetical protein